MNSSLVIGVKSEERWSVLSKVILSQAFIEGRVGLSTLKTVWIPKVPRNMLFLIGRKKDDVKNLKKEKNGVYQVSTGVLCVNVQAKMWIVFCCTIRWRQDCEWY